MSTLDLVQQDENTTFFFYRNATEGRQNITEKEPNLVKHFPMYEKEKKYLKIKCILVKHNES